jgi:hypothetical protein
LMKCWWDLMGCWWDSMVINKILAGIHSIKHQEICEFLPGFKWRLWGSTGDLKRFEATTFLKVSSPPVLVPSEVRTNLSVGIVKDRIRLNLSSSPWEKTTGYPHLGMYLGVI